MLHLDPGDAVLDRWSRTACDADRNAVYELLFALVEGRAAAYAMRTVDPRRGAVEARVAPDVVVRIRLTDDDRIRVTDIDLPDF